MDSAEKSAKELYDEKKHFEEIEKEKVAKARNTKKYAKIVAWTAGIIFILIGGGWLMAKKDYFAYDPLKLCVQHTGIGMHIHPHLKIFVKVEEMKIPANTGISGSCMRPIHTHDDTGTLHLEFPNVQNVPLEYFFKIWEKEFDWTKVKMTVNGTQNTELQSYIMHDGDKIELFFD
ncbi:MAG: hypothetical protein AAB522_00490 [Patescibacteria group bacterium]